MTSLNEKISILKREMDELQKMADELSLETHIKDTLKTGDISHMDEFFKKRTEIEAKVKCIKDKLVELQYESQCEARVNSEFAYSDLITNPTDRNTFANAYVKNDFKTVMEVLWKCAGDKYRKLSEEDKRVMHLKYELFVKMLKSELLNYGIENIYKFDSNTGKFDTYGFDPMWSSEIFKSYISVMVLKHPYNSEVSVFPLTPSSCVRMVEWSIINNCPNAICEGRIKDSVIPSITFVSKNEAFEDLINYLTNNQ